VPFFPSVSPLTAHSNKLARLLSILLSRRGQFCGSHFGEDRFASAVSPSTLSGARIEGTDIENQARFKERDIASLSLSSDFIVLLFLNATSI